MAYHTLRYKEELFSIIQEGMIEWKCGRERPRTYYIIQIIEDARFDSNKQLKDMIENHREHIYCKPIYGLNNKKKIDN